MQKFI